MKFLAGGVEIGRGVTMRTTKVVESVDIEAPRGEVFDIIANCDRRFQLSPLWGVAQVEDIAPDFPHKGSHYRVKILVKSKEPEYETIVTDFIPNQKFAYYLTVRRETRATWTVQDVPRGTRLIYQEEFLVDETGDDPFVQSVRQVVRQWLDNIKRYAELRGGWGRRLIRWLADRYFLRLRMEQRRVIIMILMFQGVAFFAFVAAAVGLAIARFILYSLRIETGVFAATGRPKNEGFHP
jgi:hypothetical protein